MRGKPLSSVEDPLSGINSVDSLEDFVYVPLVSKIQIICKQMNFGGKTIVTIWFSFIFQMNEIGCRRINLQKLL